MHFCLLSRQWYSANSFHLGYLIIQCCCHKLRQIPEVSNNAQPIVKRALCVPSNSLGYSQKDLFCNSKSSNTSRAILLTNVYKSIRSPISKFEIPRSTPHPPTQTRAHPFPQQHPLYFYRGKLLLPLLNGLSPLSFLGGPLFIKSANPKSFQAVSFVFCVAL